MESTARKAEPSTWTGRIEDDALLRGPGRFGDDVQARRRARRLFRALAARLRHDRAYRHRGRQEARRGVVAVLTAADLAEAHYHSISHPHPIPGRGGKMPCLAASPGARRRNA